MILMHICLFILIPTWIFWEDFSPPESVFCFSPVFTCRSLKKKNPHPAPIITPEINSLLINSLHLLITCSHLFNLRWSISSQSPLRTGFCHPELSYCWSCFCVSPFFFFFFCSGCYYCAKSLSLLNMWCCDYGSSVVVGAAAAAAWWSWLPKPCIYVDQVPACLAPSHILLLPPGNSVRSSSVTTGCNYSTVHS